MKTILVATDYSAPANNAAEYAAQLARASGAELVLFNAFKLSIHAKNSLASANNVDNLIHSNESKLLNLTQEIARRHQIKVRYKVAMDEPILSLKDYTRDHPVDLVVMGIESNLTEYKLFGNTTTAAIRLMQFPLLVVPNGTEFSGMRKVMYACDPSLLKENCQLTLLKTLIGAFEGHLEVFHVLREDSQQAKNELEAKMDGILQDLDHSYRYLVSSHVGEGIRNGLEQSPSDLLVMVHHKLSFLESLVKNSNSSQMTVRTQVPLLVIPDKLAC